MSKYKKRAEARLMRKEGSSIILISKKLDVSKGSVSSWCRDIVLNSEQIAKLEKNKGVSLATGRRMGAEKNKNKRLDCIREAEKWGKKLVKTISKRELLLIATALYWSEGSKSEHTSGFTFVNSDPEMILVMKHFLVTALDIPLKDITCSIQINRVHEKRIKIVLSFWRKLLNLPSNQFRKPYYIDTKINKVYDNYEDYYGICRLIVKRGMNLKYKMLGLIKAMKHDVLSG